MKLKIMSFNIQNMGKEENSWEERKHDLTELIKKYDPDILCMQEVGPHWTEWFKQNLTAWEGIGKHRQGDVGEAVPIYFKKNKYELLEDRTFWLSETPDVIGKGWDAACHRICTHIKLKSKRGKEFAIVNTHLDHRGPEAKKNGAAMVKSTLTSYDIPAILTGDFNVNETTDVYKSFPDEKVGNAKYMAKTADMGNTFNGFGNVKNPADSVIDHIFVLKKKMKVHSYKIFTDKRPNGLFVSDHYPIMATVEF